MSSFVNIAELGRRAANDPSFTMVYFDNERIRDVRWFARAVLSNTHVTDLTLERCKIGDEGAMALAEALPHNSTLTRLSLSDAGIGVKGVRALAEVLRSNSAVSELSSEALPRNSTLTELSLSGNSFGVEGVRALAEMLRSSSSLTVLILWDGNGIGDDGAMALAEALLHNSTLTELWLYDIGAEGARALARALCTNSTLTTLVLQGNSIGDEGASALLNMLYSNSSITELNFNGNAKAEGLARKLVRINGKASSPQQAHRLKVLCRIGWLLDSESAAEDEMAVSLALDQLESFPKAFGRRRLLERLLDERGYRVAASVDAVRCRVLYWYAAECGASPDALMQMLRAHPSLCACRDVKHKLYPFMLLATMSEAGAGDVLEALLLNPSVVESGIGGTECHESGGGNAS